MIIFIDNPLLAALVKTIFVVVAGGGDIRHDNMF